MITRAHCLEQAAYWQGIGGKLSFDARNHLWSAIKYSNTWHADKTIKFQRRSARAHTLAADYLTMATLIADLAPYVDSLICYGSTLSEHDGNRVAKALTDDNT